MKTEREKKKAYTLYIEETKIEQIKREAENEGRTPSNLFSHIIDLWLKSHKKVA